MLKQKVNLDYCKISNLISQQILTSVSINKLASLLLLDGQYQQDMGNLITLTTASEGA